MPPGVSAVEPLVGLVVGVAAHLVAGEVGRVVDPASGGVVGQGVEPDDPAPCAPDVAVPANVE
jgi:hypothetical protein